MSIHDITELGPKVKKTEEEIYQEILQYAKVVRISYMEEKEINEMFECVKRIREDREKRPIRLNVRENEGKIEVELKMEEEIELDIVGLSSKFFKSFPKFFDANIKNISDAQMYSFVNQDEELVITIRGTSSIMDIREDMRLRKRPFFDIIYNQFFGLKRKHLPYVHEGFMNQYNSLRFHLYYIFSRYGKKLGEGKIPRVIFASHSLGAAVSTLCAIVMKSLFPSYDIWNYTYGSPRVGDPYFAYYYYQILGQTTYRIKNMLDPVTFVPHWNYKHVGTKVSLCESEKRMKMYPVTLESLERKMRHGILKRCMTCIGTYGNMFWKSKKAHTLEEYINTLESYIPLNMLEEVPILT
jgi:predicted lipase